jgi:hypothetical protein
MAESNTYDVTPSSTGSTELTAGEFVVGGLVLVGALFLGAALLGALFRDDAESQPSLPEPDLVKVETYYYRRR